MVADGSRSVFTHYDRIAVVSMATRSDRREAFAASYRRVAGPGAPPFTFFDAITRPTSGLFLKVGSHGCFLSHLILLWQAAVAGESLLLLQDDCEFLDEARTYEIPAGTDIFYGGFSASDPENLPESDIVGAHCMGFSARAAELSSRYLTRMLDPAFRPDPGAVAESEYRPDVRPPIDGALVWFRREHPELHTVFHLLAEQRSSRSDVSPKWFDKLPGVSLARRTLR